MPRSFLLNTRILSICPALPYFPRKSARIRLALKCYHGRSGNLCIFPFPPIGLCADNDLFLWEVWSFSRSYLKISPFLFSSFSSQICLLFPTLRGEMFFQLSSLNRRGLPRNALLIPMLPGNRLVFSILWKETFVKIVDTYAVRFLFQSTETSSMRFPSVRCLATSQFLLATIPHFLPKFLPFPHGLPRFFLPILPPLPNNHRWTRPSLANITVLIFL